ncbi:hypothetical protein PIB30_009528 [Stylosanthes scabra]|uniref:Uncharacterized protein n=1 Tax=Stylosanthes scabra TaxID=79078 RepID=A0ABU6Z208_9FABA|nr:hypothetical protein [Stylosanthes scabra]
MEDNGGRCKGVSKSSSSVPPPDTAAVAPPRSGPSPLLVRSVAVARRRPCSPTVAAHSKHRSFLLPLFPLFCWSSVGGSGKGGVDGAWNKRKKKFTAPIYNCGAYATLFQSSTNSNPNSRSQLDSTHRLKS